MLSFQQQKPTSQTAFIYFLLSSRLLVLLGVMERPISLLFILLLFVVRGQARHDSFKLELIHRHAPQFHYGARPETQHGRLKDLIHHDFIRHHRRQGLRRRQAWETTAYTTVTTTTRRRSYVNAAIEMPLGAGRDYGIGQYITTFNVGTPSQKFTLIVDTGSDLTWINCRYRCGRGDHCSRPRRVFRAYLSSSFRPVPCFSRMCKVELMNLFSLTTCPTPLNPCAYDYRYLSSFPNSNLDSEIQLD